MKSRVRQSASGRRPGQQPDRGILVGAPRRRVADQACAVGSPAPGPRVSSEYSDHQPDPPPYDPRFLFPPKEMYRAATRLNGVWAEGTRKVRLELLDELDHGDPSSTSSMTSDMTF